MNARVIANASSATTIAPTTSIHGFKPNLEPTTRGFDARFCGYTGRSNASDESCTGRCAAIGGPHTGTAGRTSDGGGVATTGAPGAGWPGSVVPSASAASSGFALSGPGIIGGASGGGFAAVGCDIDCGGAGVGGLARVGCDIDGCDID